MEKPWRPRGWDGVNPKVIGTATAYSYMREDMYRHGERCADAIIEELKSEGEYIGEGHKDPELRFSDDRGWHIIFGWRVFIPDGKYK